MGGAIPPASWPASKRAYCLEIPDSIEWVELVTGVLKSLSYGYYWDKSYDNWEDARRAGLEIVLSWMQHNPCSPAELPTDGNCYDVLPDSATITWAPMNPFTEPGKVPPGYLMAPWVVANIGILAELPLGIENGDVLSGPFGLPVGTPAVGQGLARFRINFTGKGEVEVHLIKFPHAGACLLTLDDNPLSAVYTELDKDIVSVPPELLTTEIVEFKIETEGPHHIDVTMLPRFNDELLFISYGGGLRKVNFCGPQPLGPGQSVHDFGDPRGESAEQMPIRVSPTDPCILEELCGDTWQKWYDPRSCGPILGQPGVGQEIPRPGGGCVTYHMELKASELVLCPAPVSTGDTIEITNLNGVGNEGGVTPWHCGDGSTYFAGQCIGGSAGTSGSDPLPTAKHMSIIAKINTTYYDVLGPAFTVPGGYTNAQLVFLVNDSTLSDNSGSYVFDVTVCNNQSQVWSRDYVFSVNGQGWVLESDNLSQPWGVYSNPYFLGTCDQHYSPDTSYYNSVNAKIEFGFTVHLTKVVVSSSTQAGLESINNESLVQSFTGPGAPNLLINDGNVADGSSDHTWTGTHDATSLHVLIESSSGANCGTPGYARLVKVHIEGTGTPPAMP